MLKEICYVLETESKKLCKYRRLQAHPKLALSDYWVLHNKIQDTTVYVFELKRLLRKLLEEKRAS